MLPSSLAATIDHCPVASAEIRQLEAVVYLDKRAAALLSAAVPTVVHR
jgi:hypothetical protein